MNHKSSETRLDPELYYATLPAFYRSRSYTSLPDKMLYPRLGEANLK